jgi:D-beta-D-heptose 7-phosphate kinase/D-beta-D-heptose 1-phosphate adenosyltransferase
MEYILEILRKRPRVLIIGDVILDKYLYGKCDRISPEAPVPVVNVNEVKNIAGGAANIYNIIKYWDLDVKLISVIALQDLSGDELQRQLPEADLIRDHNRQNTTTKVRIMANHQQLLRYDIEDTKEIDSNIIKKILDKVDLLFTSPRQVDVLILSDYLKGVLTPELCSELIMRCNKNGIKVVVDPKGRNFDKYMNATVIKPNESEARAIFPGDIKSIAKELVAKYNLQYGLVTMSSKGVLYYDSTNTKSKMVTTQGENLVDSVGAGDVFTAFLGLTIAIGMDIESICRCCNLCSRIKVMKFQEILIRMSDFVQHNMNLNSKLIQLEELELVTKFLRKDHKKIVMTCGCFDLVHRGHLHTLQEAKKLGDILIVALNSDKSVRILKGDTRPIMDMENRIALLSNLSEPDFIITFDETTPLHILEKIRPDIMVKGGDYNAQDVIGGEYATEVKIVTFIKGMSTTNIVKKILQS